MRPLNLNAATFCTTIENTRAVRLPLIKSQVSSSFQPATSIALRPTPFPRFAASFAKQATRPLMQNASRATFAQLANYRRALERTSGWQAGEMDQERPDTCQGLPGRRQTLRPMSVFARAFRGHDGHDTLPTSRSTQVLHLRKLATFHLQQSA